MKKPRKPPPFTVLFAFGWIATGAFGSRLGGNPAWAAADEPAAGQSGERAGTSGGETRSAPLHPVTIHGSEAPGRTRTGEVDALGRPVTIACSSCHSKLPAPAFAPGAAELDSVHTGLRLAHGDLSCYSCHDPGSHYDFLRLADATPVAYPDAMTLCSQCHGPQRKDYDHGAHGGMNGYWDRTRGPRERNSCVICHDPHAPAFPKMRPTFKSLDRFLAGHGPPEETDGH